MGRHFKKNSTGNFLRCVEGAAFGGYFMAIFVLMMEYTAPDQRSKSGTLIQVAGSTAVATISVVGYIFPR